MLIPAPHYPTPATPVSRPASRDLLVENRYEKAKDSSIFQNGTGGVLIFAKEVIGDQVSVASNVSNIDYRFKFADGEEYVVRDSGRSSPLRVRRAPDGRWREIAAPEDQLLRQVQPRAEGSVDIVVEPRSIDPVWDKSAGPKTLRLTPNDQGGFDSWVVLDHSTKSARDSAAKCGVEKLAKGDGAGLEELDRAYQAKVEHDYHHSRGRKELASDLEGQRNLAGDFGRKAGKAIAGLHAAGKHEQAKALSAGFMRRIYVKDGAFSDAGARKAAIDGFAGEALEAGANTALGLVPDLDEHIPKGGDPARIYLSETNFERLSKIAEQELQKGNRKNATALYAAAARGQMGGSKMANQELAKIKHAQLQFSDRWRAEAQLLNNTKKLALSEAELDRVPPSSDSMQKYFAAKYDGKIPAQREPLEAELKRYLEVGFVHKKLDVPDHGTSWKSGDLPRFLDGRSVGDCLVMNRAVAHMLSGVGGLFLRTVAAEGHTRLLITDKNGRGSIQSNTHLVSLNGSGSERTELEARVKKAVALHPELQVLHGMPAPVVIGDVIRTGATLSDVNASYDASRNKAETELAQLTGASGKLRESGAVTRNLIHRSEAFRALAQVLVEAWRNACEPWQRDRLEDQRAALASELAKLEADLETAPTQPPSMKRFIKEQREGEISGSLHFPLEAKAFLTGEARVVDAHSDNPFELGVIRMKVD